MGSVAVEVPIAIAREVALHKRVAAAVAEVIEGLVTCVDPGVKDRDRCTNSGTKGSISAHCPPPPTFPAIVRVIAATATAAFAFA
jgi:hypothetical protein